MDQPLISPEPGVTLLSKQQGCPVCGYAMNAVGQADKPPVQTVPPKPGDFAVCMRCVCVLVFEPSMTLRILTNKEWAVLPPSERMDLTRMRTRIQVMHATVGPPGSRQEPTS